MLSASALHLHYSTCLPCDAEGTWLPLGKYTTVLSVPAVMCIHRVPSRPLGTVPLKDGGTWRQESLVSMGGLCTV